MLERFRGSVRAGGTELPADAPIEELLVRELAWAQWGPEGLYTVAALHSDEVRAAAPLDAAAILLTDR